MMREYQTNANEMNEDMHKNDGSLICMILEYLIRRLPVYRMHLKRRQVKRLINNTKKLKKYDIRMCEIYDKFVVMILF